MIHLIKVCWTLTSGRKWMEWLIALCSWEVFLKWTTKHWLLKKCCTIKPVKIDTFPLCFYVICYLFPLLFLSVSVSLPQHSGCPWSVPPCVLNSGVVFSEHSFLQFLTLLYQLDVVAPPKRGPVKRHNASGYGLCKVRIRDRQSSPFLSCSKWF